MLHSICIKTNNLQCISYLLDELDQLNLNDVCFSCKKFKIYTNIIIHYKGKCVSSFLSTLSKILTFLVLDLYENTIIKRIICLEYFYFSLLEQEDIFNLCISSINFESSYDRLESIESSFFKYFKNNKKINLTGFINFRLYNYINHLTSVVDLCVSKYIIDKEYIEFVNLLKTYIFSSPSNCPIVHLIYKDEKSILLDNKKNLIPTNKNVFQFHYLSDISFSSNDYALNSLLTIVPQKLFVHLIGIEDEFINTLRLIFGERFHLCKSCNICNTYKGKNLGKNKLN